MKFLVLAFIFRMNYNPYGDHLNYHLALQFGLFFFYLSNTLVLCFKRQNETLISLSYTVFSANKRVLAF